jgi:PAS domain S-box-containing protein
MNARLKNALQSRYRWSDLFSSRAWHLFILLLMLLVFAADSYTQLGFAHGMLYTPLILLTVTTLNPKFVIYASLLGIGLTLAGALLSPPAPEHFGSGYIWANRLLAVLALTFIGWQSWRLVRYLTHVQNVRQSMQRSRNQLRDNLRLLNMAGEVALFGGWSLSLQSYKVTWSDEVAEILNLPKGHSPSMEEAINFFHVQDRTRVNDAVEACIGHGIPFDLELRVLAGEQEPRWVRLAGQKLLAAQGTAAYVYGAVQDISRYKDVELDLLASEMRFRQLADAMPMIVWTANGQGEIDFFSKDVTELTGVSMDELLYGDGWLKLIHPEDANRIEDTWQRAVAENASHYQDEFRIRYKSGEYRWYLSRSVATRNSSGKTIKWFGSAVDIQAQKKIQQDIQELATRFEQTLENLPDGFLILTHSWQLTYLNKEAEMLLGQSRAELKGLVLWNVCPSLNGTQAKAQMLDAQSKDQPVRFEHYFDDLDKWLSFSLYPSGDRLNLMIRDTTIQRGMELQLQHAQRMESVGQLTGGVAHDFNNLLTVIQGNADLLQDALDDQPQLLALAKMIQKASAKGSRLTQQLLAFSRKQTLAPEATNINRLLRESKLLISRTLGEHIDIEFRLDKGLWHAQVDRGQLEGALLNLVINARDAMPDGGTLTLKTSNIRISGDHSSEHEQLSAGEYVMLEVTDTGVGIDSCLLEKIFEPFFTTKDAGKGTGLGLSMVFGFTKQSGGHVMVESEYAKGTKIIMYLPRSQEQEHIEPEPERFSSEDAKTEGTILLVEDDQLVREFAAAQLAVAGYQVIQAEDGPQALALLGKYPQTDLLFTDVVMPGGLNGRELAEQARTMCPDIGVLLTTGYADGAFEHDAEQRVGEQILHKPYRRDKLLETVAGVMSAAKEQGVQNA